MLGTERRYRAARRVIRPLRDRETDTRINGFISGRHRSNTARSVTTKHPDCVTDVLTQNRHRCAEG